MAGHHILEWAVPLITAFFLRVLATKGEAPTTVMMAMAGEKAAVSGVTAPDELLMHPLVTVGLILAAFAAVAFVMPAVQYRAPVAASGRQVSG